MMLLKNLKANEENANPNATRTNVYTKKATTFHVGHLVWFLFTQSIQTNGVELAWGHGLLIHSNTFKFDLKTNFAF